MPKDANGPAGENRLHEDAERSWTLPARYYTDPAILEREKKDIFFRYWNFAGHVEDLSEAGSYITLRIFDQNVVVLRGRDGALRAFHNICRHRGHELLEGRGKTAFVTCPYHSWTYDLDGQLRKARGSETIVGFDADDFCLKPVRLEEFANLIFVNLDSEAPPLRGQTGNLEAEFRDATPELDDLTRVCRQEYVIEANWKNVVDNFLECYHCPSVHPAFCDLVDLDGYRITAEGMSSTHVFHAGRADNTAYRTETADGDERSYFWAFYPNTLFGVFPGSPNFSVLNIIPEGVERTRETWDFYCRENPASDAEMAMLKYVEEVLNPEDIGVVESVQRGQHSMSFDQGRFVVDRSRGDMAEHAVHHFQRFCQTALDC